MSDDIEQTTRSPRHRFPRASEIRAVTDLTELQDLLEEVIEGVSFLETKLEFPVTEDEDWDARNRKSLSIGRAAVELLDRRIRMLTPPVETEKERTLALQLEVVRNKHAHSQSEGTKAQAEIAKSKLVYERLKLEHARVVASLERTTALHRMECEKTKTETVHAVSWHIKFVQAARRVLPPETLAEIEAQADSDSLAGVQRNLGRINIDLEKNQD